MGRISKAGTVALAAMVAGTLIAGATTAGADPAPGARSGVQDGPRGQHTKARSTVTLVTGDKVVVGSDGRVVRIDRGPGRDGVVFSVRREPGHTYVIPQDALGPVRAGVVDRRLFDVTRLVADGYDDAHRGTLPLIVGYRQGTPEGFAAFRSALDGVARDRRALPAVGGEAFTAPKSGTAALWSAVVGRPAARTAGAALPVAHLWLDGRVRASLEQSVPQIGAPTMWRAGYTGKGVKVAVLDTGVDQTHPDLKGLEVAQKNFSDSGDSNDRFGHGTHVASIVAGSGAKSAGRRKGVAPGVRLLDGKVLGDDGWGTDSSIVGGMQWAVDQGAKVVNMSLGGGDEAAVDPKEAAIARLSGKALFVVSAGNAGDEPGTIASPGSSPAALTVGAVDKQDRLADFSSRGPTAAGVSKPDITAPGVDISAAASTQGTPPDTTGYVAMSGTSMAAPHVAGSAALVLQQHPTWSGARVKALLTGSAKPRAGLGPHQQGAGRVDLVRARTAVVVSEPGSLDFGTQLWPHADDKPAVKTLTYRNLGTQAVTLKLSVAATGPAGGPAPAGMFAVKHTQVTVPAGGTAQTSVTVDTRKGAADGAFDGTVVAAGGGQSVRTAVTVVREVESYDVTFRHTDDKGANAGAYYTSVLHRGRFGLKRIDLPVNANGTAVQRLPKGDYLLESLVTSPGTGNRTAIFVQPVLKVTGKTTVALDARKARPFAVTAPDPAAKLTSAVLGYDAPAMMMGTSWSVGGSTKLTTAGLGPVSAGMQAQYQGVWKVPGTAGRNVDYRFAFHRAGSWFTGLTQAVTRAQVAEVRLGVGASVAAKGRVYATPYGASGFSVGSQAPLEGSLPMAVTQYVNTAGVDWHWSAAQLDARGDEAGSHSTGPVAYTAGKRYALNFNTGVLGPDLGASAEQGASRYGNTIETNVQMFVDGEGHDGGYQADGYTRLESGGRVIASNPSPGWLSAEVPAASAAYRLTVEANRSPAHATTSTKVTAVWTFTSARPSGEQAVKLPLSTVRLAPKLRLNGTAPAGGTLKVPLHVAGAAAAAGKPATLAVSVSYDGGRTWKALTVTTDAKGARSVTVQHPSTAKAATFRVDLKDKSGNTVRETITNAYRLAP
ncbi:S8 family peptidase [Streptomyces bambusae]|uniref:S8 family peptidase n=1 Tax=Streptomyces bambusae TaxID=1550616 RepID=UPI001CFE11C3|nr:S8 family peptidase [Streptomyces bambusae]MCB5165848.1 S8 family peptidase [Streptomyces bambusae]